MSTTDAFSQNISANTCQVQSGAQKTPVIELYTSEGCSSCPPADQWLTALKTKTDAASAANPPVLQAFHVGYWDYIGWVDRFATPAHTTRQRQIAAWNRQTSIYTPQLVHNGRDWRDWHHQPARNWAADRELANVSISLKRVGPDQYEALVTPLAAGAPSATATSVTPPAPLAPLPASWSAYWTLTEDGHSSKVKTGENAGEFLKHDAVVRQYTAAGDYRSTPGSAQKLSWRSIAATPGHPRRVNLVVFDSQTGRTLQAVSAPC